MHLLPRFALATALLLCGGVASSTPATYTIYSKISRVNLSLEHQGFIQVSGTLKITPGSFVFDSQDWSQSSVDVTMPTRTIDMGDAFWNSQIQGDPSWKKLFDTPHIRFRSTRLEQSGAAQGVLQGELTLAGITRPVALQMRINKMGRNAVTQKQAIGITASGTIKRSQFGLDAYADLVGDELAVHIQLEAAIGPDPDAQRSSAQ